MKIKMLLPVILLAVLTIGAVGASDDISDDSLAVDNTQDSIGESCVEEILEDTDSGDTLESTQDSEIALAEPLKKDSNIKENATGNDILQTLFLNLTK